MAPGFISVLPNWRPLPPGRGFYRPSADYFAIVHERLTPERERIYRYLAFDEMEEFTLHYTGAHF